MRALEEKLRQGALTAPIPGIIIAADSPGDKPLARGRPVAQGELLLSIADHEQIAVVTRVDEVDVRKVKVGQRATITGPGFPDLEIAGGVTYVSARANDNARQRNTSQFEVIVALDPLEAAARARLRVGMSAYITIVVHNNPGALLAPVSSRPPPASAMAGPPRRT